MTSYRGMYLISELNRLVSTGDNALELEAAIFLGIFYNLNLHPELSSEPSCIEQLKKILEQKGTFVYKYSPLSLAYSVKLTGEMAIRLS